MTPYYMTPLELRLRLERSPLPPDPEASEYQGHADALARLMLVEADAQPELLALRGVDAVKALEAAVLARHPELHAWVADATGAQRSWAVGTVRRARGVEPIRVARSDRFDDGPQLPRFLHWRRGWA